MNRFLVLTAFVLCLGLVAFSTAAAVPDARLSIDAVDVDPETPTAGSPVTLTPTIESSAGSTEPVDIESVTLEDGDETLVNVTNSGALSPTDAVSVPLTTTFDDPGTYDLMVNVTGTDAEGETTTVQRPVTLVVEPGGPQLEINTVDAVNETVTTIEGLVTNPTEATLRDIELSVAGDGFEGMTDRRTISSLEAGEEREVTFELRPEAIGSLSVETTATYRTGSGTEDTVSRIDSLTVEESQYDVSIEVTAFDSTEQDDDDLEEVGDIGIDIPGIGGTSGIDSESSSVNSDVGIIVSNVGNAPVTDVMLDSQADGESFSVRPVSTELLPGEEQTLPISLAERSASNLTFEAGYDAGGVRETVVTGIDRSTEQGSVTVTSADLAIDGDQATITGDLGNTGSGAVTGVVVGVGEGDAVSPAYPARDFFLGEIEGDGFAPFELTATVGENATQVPLEVQYTVDGEERTETVSLPVEEQPETEDDGLPSFVIIGGLAATLVGLALLLIVLYLRKR